MIENTAWIWILLSRLNFSYTARLKGAFYSTLKSLQYAIRFTKSRLITKRTLKQHVQYWTDILALRDNSRFCFVILFYFFFFFTRTIAGGFSEIWPTSKRSPTLSICLWSTCRTTTWIWTVWTRSEPCRMRSSYGPIVTQSILFVWLPCRIFRYLKMCKIIDSVWEDKVLRRVS